MFFLGFIKIMVALGAQNEMGDNVELNLFKIFWVEMSRAWADDSNDISHFQLFEFLRFLIIPTCEGG